MQDDEMLLDKILTKRKEKNGCYLDRLPTRDSLATRPYGSVALHIPLSSQPVRETIPFGSGGGPRNVFLDRKHAVAVQKYS